MSLNWALEYYESAVQEWKTTLIQTIVFEAGRQGLTPEDVLILAGQHFPSEKLYNAGSINLEHEKSILNDPRYSENLNFRPWKFLDNLYREQLNEFYRGTIRPVPQEDPGA
jgi:hypothetical protein